MLHFTLTLLLSTSLWAHPLSDQKTRIIGGQTAVPSQFPWQAAININYPNSTPNFCSGTIITGRFILTAAQCVDNADHLVIYLGTNVLNLGESEGPTLIAVTEVFVKHSDYDPLTLENDIALIQAYTGVGVFDNIKEIPLGSTQVEADTLATISGWGKTLDSTDTEGTVNELNFVQVLTIPNQNCQTYFSSQIFDSMICTLGSINLNDGICPGDTGSGLIANLTGEFSLIGVASFTSGNGCKSGDPSGFTRIEPYIEWIRGNIY